MGLTQGHAQPVGASVIAGQAQVLSSGATTVVNQSSSKAIINWQDFSVGTGASVQFNQPNSSAITLNRVTGSNLSTIDGAIRANGQVWLLNPNGVLFGNNARINVGGLLATTSDLANQDFNEGRYNFTGGKNSIVNNGAIQAGSGGSVILSAPNVTNRGLISANAGHVVLGGTDTFTVDFNGDHLLSYAVGASSQTGSVTNNGKIQAQGGTVLMTARAASGVQDAVINNTGMVEATTARNVNGEIVLDAGEGTATNSGTLDASGKGTGETGGTVKVLGRLAAVPDNAVIDVSGTRGGGTVLIGGNFHGAGPERNAQNTSVGKAVIKVDAILAGDGGKVAVWSDGTTDFAGAISARGGAMGGNGGQVETSGHNLRIAQGATVNALAPYGRTGQWLLDPADIDINATGVTAHTETFASDNFSGTSTIMASTIDTALQTADLSLQASNDIVINAAVNITTATTNGRTFTLEAGRSIVLNQPISYAGGNIVMIAASPNVPPAYITAGYRQAFPASISGSGMITASQLDLTLNSDGVDGSAIGAAAPVLALAIGNATNLYLKTLNANAYLQSTGTLIIGNSNHATGLDVGTGTATLTANSIQQSAPILASVLNATATATGSAGTLSLGGAANVIGTVNLAADGAIGLYNAGNLTVGQVKGNAAAAAASFVAQSTGALTVASPTSGATITSSGLTLLHASGAITQGSGTSIKAPTVSLISDNGTLGSAATPLALSTSSLASRTLSRDQYYAISPFNGSTTLVFNNVVTTSSSMIAATSTPGVNAGSGGNVVITASGLAVNSFSNGSNTFSINAGNFQVAASQVSIQGSTFNSFSANTTGNITINNNGSFQIRNLNGGSGISTGSTGNVNLTATAGSITQFAGATGAITAASLFGGTVTNGNIILTNGLNAVPSVTFNAVGNITFFNSISTILNRASYIPSGTPVAAQSVDIEVLGAGHTLTLGASTVASNVAGIFANSVTLHANSDIVLGGTGAVSGINVGLISDTGSIGTLSASGGQIPLRGVSTLAARAAGNIYLINSATVVNNAPFFTPIVIGSVANLGPGGGTINGLTAGGTIELAFGSTDVQGPSTIKADTLFIAGHSIELDDVSVNTLSAQSQAGDIDITSSGSFNINNTVSLVSTSGIQTTGNVSLQASGNITQSSGTAGAIIGGSLSVFGIGGVKLDNGANAITGIIQLGSLGDALLINSLASHLNIGLAGGTFTLISGGDLELVAGPSIATLSSGQNLTINNANILSAIALAQINGIVVSLKIGGDGVVLSTPGKFINNFGATALVLGGGSRFLIYSGDPANDLFGGLKTPNAAIFGASYPTAVSATGNRYIFSVASSTNTDFLSTSTAGTGTGTGGGNAGLRQGGNTAAAPALVGFISGLQPPPHNPPPPPPPGRADVLQIQGAPPPPPPPPPPRNSPLADLSGPDGGNAEPPSSSDQATSYVVSSLEGGPPPISGGSGGGTIIPRYLTAQPNPPAGTLEDPSMLPGFGNLSLWQ